MKLAIPTLGQPGLASERSGHFGHCDCFTVVDIQDGQITAVSELANKHDELGCVGVVGYLAQEKIDGILAAGMGMRPLMAFQECGIAVYYEAETPIVGNAVQLIIDGKVPTMGTEHACSHHGGCHE